MEQVRMRLISQLIKAILRVLQKLLDLAWGRGGGGEPSPLHLKNVTDFERLMVLTCNFMTFLKI